MEKKKVVIIEVSRINGKTYLEFQVDESIETIFKEKSEEIKESQNWKGLKFYYLPKITNDEQYKRLLSSHNLIDDFGAILYDNQRFNIAFIRTVGGKGKIEVPADIPFAIISIGMKNMVSFLKEYYENFIKDYSVKGEITFEV